MKKIFLAIALFAFVSIKADAQVKTESGDNKTKVKPILTPKDRAHNLIHPKKKQAHGVKYKHKSASGKKTTVKAKTANAVPKKED